MNVVVTREQAEQALLYLTGLVAARAGHGISEVRVDNHDNTISGPYQDERSNAVLDKVVKLLLADHERVGKEAAKVLVGPIHEVVTDAFELAKHDPAIMEDVEDIVAEGLRRMGYTLSDAQMKTLRIDDSVLAKHQHSASAAAAEVVSQMALGQKARNFYNVKNKARELPASPGALGKRMPFPAMRHYVTSLMDREERRLAALETLPLDALHGDDPAALIAKAEKQLVAKGTETFRRDYDKIRETMCTVFLDLMRGADPTRGWNLPPDTRETWRRIGEEWGPIRQRFPMVVENPVLARQLALELADQYIALLAGAFGFDVPQRPKSESSYATHGS